MSDAILRRDRVNTAKRDDFRKLTTLIDDRISESIEQVEKTNGSIVYGYVGVDAELVYQKAVDPVAGAGIIVTPDWQGNSATNRALFGNLLEQTATGTKTLLLQQYVACAGEIRNPLSLFLNSESLRLDGWAGQPTGDANRWQWCAHHFNVRSLTGDAAVAATALATAYVPGERTSGSDGEGLTLVTGIYHGRDRFDGIPSIFIILMGQWPAKRLTSAGALESYTSGTAGNYGLHSCLLDWLTSSDYGPGLGVDQFDTTSWRTRSAGGIALTQDSAATGLTDRIREPAYDADTADPKNTYSNIGSPIPNLAEWPVWGSINTGRTYGEILQEFTAACPPLLLWWDLNGKLKANVRDLDGLTSPTVDFRVGDDDLLDLPAIDIPETAYSFGNVEIKYREYTEDFRESVFDGTSALTSGSYNTAGTYQYQVPDGATSVTITLQGGAGAAGGLSNFHYSQNLEGVAGGAGGTGYTPGTAGGRGGSRIYSSTDAGGQGGVNRAGTGYTGNRIPNGGVGNSYYSQQGNLVYSGSDGSRTDLSDVTEFSSEWIARQGTGGGGGSGDWFAISTVGGAVGGGGGGGGGSSAVLRGATVLLEATGGRGGGGDGAGDNSDDQVAGKNGQVKVFNGASVTPGEMLTVFVGQGGRGVENRLEGSVRLDEHGEDGSVLITAIATNDPNAERTQESVALCGCKPHARKISRELALRSQMHKISLRLTRKFLGVEPGDIVEIGTTMLTAKMIVTDRAINPDLTVDVVGLKLLA